jgi:hypothetical protein
MGGAPGAEDAFTNRLNEVCALLSIYFTYQQKFTEIGSVNTS